MQRRVQPAYPFAVALAVALLPRRVGRVHGPGPREEIVLPRYG